MRVLVTGATGFIGQALAARLAGRGDRVRALVRATSDTARLRALGVELVEGSLAAADLDAALDGCDAAVHLAGAVKASRPGDFLAVNGAGTRAVAQACRQAARAPVLVYVSSLAAAGPAPGRPRTEEDPPAPVSRYGESKLAGEAAVREVASRVPASIVRPPVVFGPGDREFLPPLARMVRLGVALRGPAAPARLSLVHVDDLCAGILAVLDRGARVAAEGPGGTYFLADGPLAWEEVVRAAAGPAAGRLRFLPVPLAAVALAALGSDLWARASGRPAMLSLDKLRELRQPDWTCDAGRARRELGWAPGQPLPERLREAASSWGAAVERHAPGAAAR